ncbi:hypothetical protein [Bartonella jaculi]|uniref:Uncharacterized protein n=1 Tax=Bartonella jaculi TaxID=686226 RepID=A0ABP9N298_9HYPH
MGQLQKLRLSARYILNEILNEKENREKNAKQADLSLFTYLRSTGWLQAVKNDLNYETVKERTPLQGALGRVSGLLNAMNYKEREG